MVGVFTLTCTSEIADKIPNLIKPMTAATPAHDITADRQFIPWLQQEQISLACTTYQTHRLMLLGVNPETGGISGFERVFEQAMGLYATTERFYISSKYQIWQLDNVLSPGQNYNGYDKLYIPRIGYTTGDLDVHDLGVDRGGRLVFIATMLNCLATLSDRHSCQPLWKPPFISQIINEDRCHLNGLAMVAGQPGYVTAVSRSDIVDGWRDRRESGGVVIDINSNEIVATGLSMPHSPRWYQDKLWLLNSGKGELGYIDLATGKFEVVAFCPGYLRGLAFWGNYAIAGLSKPRKGDKTLFGLPLDELLATRDSDPRCGLMVVDLTTGAIVHWLRFEGVVTELYDVQVIPGVQRPMALGFKTEEIAQLITLEPLANINDASVQDSQETFTRNTANGSVQDSQEAVRRNTANGSVQNNQETVTRNTAKIFPSSPSPHSLQPVANPAQAFLQRSRILKQEGNLAEAELCLREAIRLDANNWAAYNNLGTLLQNQGHRVEAKTCYEKALQLQPNFAEAISNLASIWQLEEEVEKAKTGFYRALQLKPDYVPAHFNLANIFQEQKRMGVAVEHFQKVLEIDPNYTEAYFSLGGIYEYQSKLTEALECYEQVEKLNPDPYYVRTFINYIYLKLCNWQGNEERNQEVIRLVEAHLTNPKSIFSPLNLSSFPVPLSLHQAFAKTFASSIIQKAAATKQRLNFQHSRTTPKKLRLGYISPDFREHAVGRLIYQIFECHDREQFEVYGYSTVDLDDHITQKVRSGCDVFVDLSPLSSEAAARRIYSDGIHILIDLAGYTIGNAATTLALQPAPIQAQFLGYPDTMGAEFIQYAIADSWLITPEIAESYTEAIIYLPHAFVASPLEISPKPMTRAEFGLPEEAFVCCCFNSHYKINPPVFDVWMGILRQVPDAVLWLSGENETVEQNLRGEAKNRGIEPERIIFATKLPQDEYLARYALADLYLDTFVYNAGSTAAAVLWAGLPLLTCPGETNASRMGASICAAAGFEEMICQNVVEYERRAVYLATHPQELAEIRHRLQEKLKSPSDRPTLFQVHAFVSSLESACQIMWQNYAEGHPLDTNFSNNQTTWLFPQADSQ